MITISLAYVSQDVILTLEMSYKFSEIANAAEKLKKQFEASKDKGAVLRAPEIKGLFANIPKQNPDQRKPYGQEVNRLKQEIQKLVEDSALKAEKRDPIDVTASLGINSKNKPSLFDADQGTNHPLMQEIDKIIDIFLKMGFDLEDSRQLDSEYNMFTALNFPGDHPAKDDYDSFATDEGLLPSSHTSTMQNRILTKGDPPIRVIIPGRVYRNEDVDATHDHTFYQLEGVYVDEGISLGDMLGAVATFFEAYFEQKIEFRTQPFYFPFVEPGLEFLIKMPDSLKKKGHKGDKWLEVGGCGMIHPNVLKEANIDANKYTGFAWGFGLDRMVMLKHGIEDVRYFHSAKLEFLRQFK